MFGIGGFELFIILVFGFLIFGPDKLPEIAKTVGKGIARFREAQQEMNDTLGGEKIFDPNNPDEPFKDPVEVLDRIAQKQEDKRAGKVTAGAAGATAAAASSAKPAAEKAAPAASDAASPKAGAAKQESFTERKARYERERAARKAAEAAALSSSDPGNESVNGGLSAGAHSVRPADSPESANGDPATADDGATASAPASPTAASPAEGGDA